MKGAVTLKTAFNPMAVFHGYMELLPYFYKKSVDAYGMNRR